MTNIERLQRRREKLRERVARLTQKLEAVRLEIAEAQGEIAALTASIGDGVPLVDGEAQEDVGTLFLRRRRADA